MNPDTVDLGNSELLPDPAAPRPTSMYDALREVTIPGRIWGNTVERLRKQEETIQGLLAELNEQDERTKKLLRRADKGLRRAARRRRRFLRELRDLRDFKTTLLRVNKQLLAEITELEDRLNNQPPPPSFLDRLAGWLSWSLR